MKHLFISYARQDGNEIAEHLYARLTGAEYHVWKDDHCLALGSNFPKELFNAVDQNDYFLPIITKAALQSHWVEDEIGTAKVLRKRIIPILLENNIELPPFLKATQALQMTKGVNDWRALDKLVNHLEEGNTIHRVYNMSGHKDIEVKGLLVLDHCDFKRADLNDADSLTRIAQEMGASAVPYIKDAGAGIVPHGHPALSSAILAYLLGAVNLMPKIFYTHKKGDGKFQIDKKVFIRLQDMREQGFKDRSNNKV